MIIQIAFLFSGKTHGILKSFEFSWTQYSFETLHKGSEIVQFRSNSEFLKSTLISECHFIWKSFLKCNIFFSKNVVQKMLLAFIKSFKLCFSMNSQNVFNGMYLIKLNVFCGMQLLNIAKYLNKQASKSWMPSVLHSLNWFYLVEYYLFYILGYFIKFIYKIAAYHWKFVNDEE